MRPFFFLARSKSGWGKMAAPQQISDAMTLPPDKHYASADKPVNRRTALREQAREQPENPLLRQRLQNTQARQLLGAPLAAQLGAPPQVGSKIRYAVFVFALVVIAAGLALITQLPGLPVLLAGSGITAMGIGAGIWAWRSGRHHGSTPATPPGFGKKQMARLDQVLEQVAPLVPANILERLLALKATLLRIAPLLSQAGAGEALMLDDHHFVVECVRRYLPDTLQAYLDIPATVRDAHTADAPSPAQESLGEQLDLLQAELGRREALLARGATERLQQQQRFLEAKQKTKY
jgi:hypothetical protein